MPKKDAAKEAKKKEAKAAKQAKKTAKGAIKQAKASGEEVEEDIERILAAFVAEDAKKTAVTLTAVERPGPRSNFSLSVLPGSGEVLLFGGELNDGANNHCYNELYRGTGLGPADKWTLVSSPNTPPPRCSHQAALLNSAAGWQLYVYGGEFATNLQFYHYNDSWRLDVASNRWTRIDSKRAPSPRSGHRMLAWRNFLVLFGGFHQSYTSDTWHRDLWVMDARTHEWREVVFPGTAQQPAARSGMQFHLVPGKDVAIMYGGYSEVKAGSDALSVLPSRGGAGGKGGKPGAGSGGVVTASAAAAALMAKKSRSVVHQDLWLLKLAPLLGSDGSVRAGSGAAGGGGGAGVPVWERVRTAGAAPSSRLGFSAAPYRDRLIVFGGVADADADERGDDLVSTFFNDVHSLQVDSRRWYSLGLKDAKGRDEKDAAAKARRAARKAAAAAAARGGAGGDDDDDDALSDEGDDDEDDADWAEFNAARGGSKSAGGGGGGGKKGGAKGKGSGGSGSGGYDHHDDGVDDDAFYYYSGGKLVRVEAEEEEEEEAAAAESAAEASSDASPATAEPAAAAAATAAGDVEDGATSTAAAAAAAVIKKSKKKRGKGFDEEAAAASVEAALTSPAPSAATSAAAGGAGATKAPAPGAAASAAADVAASAGAGAGTGAASASAAASAPAPCPRMKASVWVEGHHLYVYGGMYEGKAREYTLDDAWRLDLRERTAWECLLPARGHDWRGEDSDDDDDDEDEEDDDEEDDDEEDEEDEDEDGDDDDVDAGSDAGSDDGDAKGGRKGGKSSASADAAAGGDGKGRYISAREREQERIRRLRDKLGLEDPSVTPTGGEALSEFFARTSDVWVRRFVAEGELAEGERIDGKALRKKAFAMARARYDEVYPTLCELREAEEVQRQLELAKASARGGKRRAMGGAGAGAGAGSSAGTSGGAGSGKAGAGRGKGGK